MLKGHADAVYAVTIAPDGRTVAAAGADTKILLWDGSRFVPEKGEK